MWKTIEGTNGSIQVNECGEVKSTLRGDERILKTQKDKKGYHRISFTIKGQKRTIKVHREVAKAFIPNPDNLPQVNHIDGNKDNNAADNLEWCTNRQNCHHAIANGLWSSVIAGAMQENEKRKKPVIACKEGERLRFESVSAAERHFNSRHISAVLKGKRNYVKGWTFKYEGGD